MLVAVLFRMLGERRRLRPIARRLTKPVPELVRYGLIQSGFAPVVHDQHVVLVRLTCVVLAIAKLELQRYRAL